MIRTLSCMRTAPGSKDPRSYAHAFLEKGGHGERPIPQLASHWLTEAANVWILSLNDAHRAARALMIAIDRDPTQPAPRRATR